MTEAKRCSCSADGAKADLSSEDLFELVVVGVLVSAEEEILDAAAAPDFLPILIGATRRCAVFCVLCSDDHEADFHYLSKC